MWSSRRGRKHKFDMLAKQMLLQLDELKLGWLLFIPKSFGAKWGGWVSKNYQSLTRVALWIYGPLMAIDDGPPYEDPVGDPMKWTNPLLVAWLKARGLDGTGNRDVLLPRVMHLLLGDPTNIPPIQPNLYGNAEDMLDMIKSLVLLVTTVLQNSVQRGTRDTIELRVRLFLNRFERFDAPMRRQSCKPTYVTSYNYLSLLNLGTIVAEFGPMRRYFEGKWLGERYVQAVKDERSRCGPNNVYFTLMRKLHRSKSMQPMTTQTKSSDDSGGFAMNTKIFGSSQEIDGWYTSNKPIPFVIVDGEMQGVLYYQKGRNIGVDIVMRVFTRHALLENDMYYHGLRYWKFSLSHEPQSLVGCLITDFGVLLPKIGFHDIGVYTVVTKNWSTEMYGYYNFQEESDNDPMNFPGMGTEINHESKSSIKFESDMRDAFWC
jgi:hypothetical protein